MGLIYWWCRFASHVPDLANAVTQWPGISTFAKWLGGVAPQRRLPSFARQTFTARHRHRKSGNEGRPRVVLWPDTFNNYFYPDTAVAAVDVLEAAGWQVTLPRMPLCCGRSEARRVGKECVSTCMYRGSPYT